MEGEEDSLVGEVGEEDSEEGSGLFFGKEKPNKRNQNEAKNGSEFRFFALIMAFQSRCD